jgi:hypothetical protein
LRIFITKVFDRFRRKENIDDSVLLDAIDRAERGLIDADLGGYVIKQRIARQGQGKSGGYRTIIIFRSGDRSFFVHGYSKSEKDNVSEVDLKGFKESATELLNLEQSIIEKAIETEKLREVIREE